MSTREGSPRASRTRTRNDGADGGDAGTLKRLQTRAERLLQFFPEIGKTLLREGEPGLEAVLGQLQSLRGQVSKRAQETGGDLQERAERILADLERQAVRSLKPLLVRANVASHAEIETLERRLAHVEGRIGPLLDDRSHLSTRLLELERQVTEARGDVSERLREIALRLTVTDELRGELAELRAHLDALSKDQVTRSLDLGKQHDRLVRLEMRFGDFLKDHGAASADREQSRARPAIDERELEDLRAQLRTATEEATAAARAVEDVRRIALTAAGESAASAAAARATAERLSAIGAERAKELTDSEALGRRMADLERTLRQIELRLGDLGERHTAVREELAALTARLGQLELTAAHPGASGPLGDRAEGH